MDLETTYHEDGTVTYWSVFRQLWMREVPPVRELAAMSAAERDTVIDHVMRHGRAGGIY